MSRWLLAAVVVGLQVQVAAQSNVLRLFGSIGSIAGEMDAAPSITIQVPTLSPTFSTTASSIDLAGIASDDVGIASLAWSCLSGCMGSGIPTGSTAWEIPSGVEAETVFADAFSSSGSNTDLSSWTLMQVGSGWVKRVDTAGTASVIAHTGHGDAMPATILGSQRVMYEATHAALSSTDYIWRGRASRLSSSADDAAALVFGAVDGDEDTDYCAAVWRPTVATGTDVWLIEYVAGTPTVLDSGVGDVQAGSLVTIDRSASGTSVTIGSETLTADNSHCSGLKVGIGFGNFVLPADDISTAMAIDAVELIDRGASISGVGLELGANLVQVCATDTAAQTSCDTVTITQEGTDAEAPQISIVTPLGPIHATATAAVTLSGTASDNVALAGPATFSCPGADPESGSTTSSAPYTSWTLQVDVPDGDTTCTVTAEDTSTNTGQASRVIRYEPSDTDAPTIDIVLPDDDGSFDTSSSPVTVSGTAADTGGSGLSVITWANSLGGAGSAVGLSAWSVSVPLSGGANVITVRAVDTAGNEGTDSITITLPAPCTITTTSMPAAVEGAAYTFTLSQSNCEATRTWGNNGAGTTLNDSDPHCAGLSINSSTGAVAGTPSAAGICTWVASITDGSSDTDTSDTINLAVNAEGAGGNAYFDSISALESRYVCYSLRPQVGVGLGAGAGANCHYANQLLRPNQGGYHNSNSATQPLAVTYDFAGDTDPHKQDAAKFRIPAFSELTTVPTLNGAINSSVQTITLSSGAGPEINDPGRSLMLNNSEIVTMVAPACSGAVVTNCAFNNTTKVATVMRGQFGTSAVDHASGVTARPSSNGPMTHLRLPITTTDGYTYLWTMDVYPTSSFLFNALNSHKWARFQARFGASGSPTIWLEPRWRYAGYDSGHSAANGMTGGNCYVAGTHVAAFDIRSYNQGPNGSGGGLPAGPEDWTLTDGARVGPGVTDNDPLHPFRSFCIKANEWTRFWWRIEQKANGYEHFSMWAASETQDPVQIVNHLPLSVDPNYNEISLFTIEMNSSDTEIFLPAPYTQDRVQYLKNFVGFRVSGLAADGALSDANIEANFLEKPVP